MTFYFAKNELSFINREIFVMQIGGMSNSVKGLFDAYQVKQNHCIMPLYQNLYYLIKGVLGYYCKSYGIR